MSSLARASLLFFVALAGCAGTSSREAPGVSQIREPEIAASALEDAGAPDASPTGEAVPAAADDAELDAILSSTGVPGTPNPRAALGLRFAVVERGPDRPWLLAVINDGEQPVKFMADPRLLRFKVHVPGKKQPVSCELPASLVPDQVDRRLEVVLEPGEAIAHGFDARLYCFASAGQKQLVPGAIITPYFGWKGKTRTTWKKGKKVVIEGASQPPFVAELLEPEASNEATDAGTKAPADDEPGPGTHLKELEGNTFALRSSYSEWVSKAAEYSQKNPNDPLRLVVVQGSDAQAERSATVEISLKNTSKTKQRVYFRRELVSFEVMGPDGLTTCDPQPDLRSPDPQAFSTLAPGGSLKVTSRLVELCSNGSFARPGLYLVHARFDAVQGGDAYGLQAYLGTVASPDPASVRIRSGELPFLRKHLVKRSVGDGPAQAAGSQ